MRHAARPPGRRFGDFAYLGLHEQRHVARDLASGAGEYRRLGADARLQQFKCVEFVEELMYGDLRKEPLK